MSKFWALTINNYNEQDVAEFGHLFSAGIICYYVTGYETSESGTDHIQGYVEFKCNQRLSALKKRWPRCHAEPRKGTAYQASEYCKKDGTYVEEGQISKGQGARTDLDEIRKKIDQGVPELEIAQESFQTWCQYRKAFTAYKALLNPPRHRPEIKVITLTGLTGTGKTSVSFELFPDAWIATDPTLQWFDGYSGQSVVILDEYIGSCFHGVGFLLRLLDIYPTEVPVKGGFVPWNPDIIIITSNRHPHLWHAADWPAIDRRLYAQVIFNERRVYSDEDQTIRLRKSLSDAINPPVLGETMEGQ